MKRIPDSMTPVEAWGLLSLQQPLGIESRPVADARGHCLAEQIRVPCDVPDANRSFMDGFAVRSADVASVPAKLKVRGEVFMGKIPATTLNPGEAMSIPTGGFLPKGSDAVVMQEDITRTGDELVVRRSVSPQENVQRQGEDFKANDCLFDAHHVLRAQDIAALATFGIKEVRVYRKPVLAIISTGNELVPFEHEPEPAQIRETNALALSGAAQQFGFTVHTLGIVRDELDAQIQAMKSALDRADVVLVSGGSSVGERDFTLEVIRSFANSSVIFHGLAIRPGNPTIFARVGDRFVFGLPGQPVSSLIVFYQFVLPYLFHLSGEQMDYGRFNEQKFASVFASLDQEVKPLKIKTDYMRVRLRFVNDKWVATPVAGKSASLSTLSQADGFTIIAPGDLALAEGTSIRTFIFP